MADEREVPGGRLGRFARLAAMGVRTGAGMLLDRDGSAAAKHAAEVLGTLRGLAAKVGQMASYVDGIVPEGQRDAYEASMKVLLAQAPRSSPAAVRARVEAELGAPMEQLFAEWDDEPVASASIGQVHRAVLPSGDEVAVKVQHPGIERAIESDLSNAGILEGFAGTIAGRRFDTHAMLDVIRTRFREELDYALEATRLEHFARVHDGDPTIRVPRLHRSHSSKRVLTAEFVRGLGFDEACAAPEAERHAWAMTLWRFVFKGNMVGGMFNADPHPGNYVFHPEGVVTFLDYGCVQELPDHRRRHARAAHRAAIARDERAFAKVVSEMLGARPGRLEPLAQRYTRQCFEPLFGSPYRITRAYAAGLVRDLVEVGREARKIEGDEFFSMPPEMVFMNRLQFGFYSVLARMDVCVDYAAVEKGFLPASE